MTGTGGHGVEVLRGRRVVVPVTAERRDLAVRLAQQGMQVDEVQFIAIDPPGDPAALETATRRWCEGHYDWMAVTSRNAVRAMARLAEAEGTTLAQPQPTARVATVGEATLKACADAGLEVSLVPTEAQNASGLVKAMGAGTGRVLAPLGNLASPVLVRGMSRQGWEVESVEAYRTVDGPGPDAALVADLAADRVDAVVLTSGSVAERLAATCPSLGTDTMVVAIGATTAAAAKAAGLAVDSVATHPSYDGCVASLITALNARDGKEAP